jgi:hypothetical protein
MAKYSVSSFVYIPWIEAHYLCWKKNKNNFRVAACSILNSRWPGRFGIKYNDIITIQIKLPSIQITAFDCKTMDSSSNNESFALFSVRYFLLFSTCMDIPWLSHLCRGSCGELLILDRQSALVLFAWENNDLPFRSWGLEESSG